MTTNHPAHGPVSLDRLHQIREILSKASAQSDGGNLGYAMADAVKVIDGVLESIASEQVRCEHAAWSQATFGGVGPVGPLKHLSKELAKLFRKITNSEIDAEGNAHVVLFPADILLINNARIALASLEAEAVAYMHHSGQVVTREECCDDKIFAICCKVETPLYAAPQLPQPAPEALKRLRSIVADPKTLPRRKEWISGQQYSYVLLESVEAMVDDACRAAMLQAGNSPVIGIDLASEPDRSVEVRYLAPPGYVIVPIVPTEDMIINGFESVPDPHFSDEKEWEEYEALSGCRQAARRAELCWAAMIKAAPKQENI